MSDVEAPERTPVATYKLLGVELSGEPLDPKEYTTSITVTLRNPAPDQVLTAIFDDGNGGEDRRSATLSQEDPITLINMLAYRLGRFCG